MRCEVTGKLQYDAINLGKGRALLLDFIRRRYSVQRKSLKTLSSKEATLGTIAFGLNSGYRYEPSRSQAQTIWLQIMQTLMVCVSRGRLCTKILCWVYLQHSRIWRALAGMSTTVQRRGQVEHSTIYLLDPAGASLLAILHIYRYTGVVPAYSHGYRLHSEYSSAFRVSRC